MKKIITKKSFSKNGGTHFRDDRMTLNLAWEKGGCKPFNTNTISFL